MDSATSSNNIMEKKSGQVCRGQQLPSKTGQDATNLKENGNRKAFGHNARKKDYDKPDSSKKVSGGRNGKQVAKQARPREKTGGEVGWGCEAGSLYRSGSKKQQSITHLMNWWKPNERSNSRHHMQQRQAQTGRTPRRSQVRSHQKYSKEHYLQANCQFVVVESGDYSVHMADADLLVDWHLIQEVHLFVTQSPNCPICLHPPVAPKIPRCGHIYCYPCILHYLALSDEKWRNCPICDAPIHKEDLKSVCAVERAQPGVGEEVELQLMRRERDSLLPAPAASVVGNSRPTIHAPPRLSQPSPASPYSKLILATRDEIRREVLERERVALEVQLADEKDTPEACFIQEALNLLNAWEDQLMREAVLDQFSSFALGSPTKEQPMRQSSLNEEVSVVSPPPLDEDSAAMYDDARKPSTEFAASEGGDDSTVTVADLDISLLQPSQINDTSNAKAPKSVFYFYQATNGANVYLHALNIQMLVHEYGHLEKCPHTIKARIVEKESASMTQELRQRLRYLRHMSITCPFEVVEVNLKPPVVSEATADHFMDKVEARHKWRQKRARAEKRVERRIRQEEDRLMGRAHMQYTQASSTLHFPSFSSPDLPLQSCPQPIEGAVGGESEYSMSPPLCESPPESSLLDPPPVAGGKSFAQLMKEKSTRPGGAWGGPPPPSATANAISPRSNQDSDEEDYVPVPEYKNAFGDAVQQALDSNRKQVLEAGGGGGDENGKKKGKKKKGRQKIVLFSSGGFAAV